MGNIEFIVLKKSLIRCPSFVHKGIWRCRSLQVRKCSAARSGRDEVDYRSLRNLQDTKFPWWTFILYTRTDTHIHHERLDMSSLLYNIKKSPFHSHGYVVYDIRCQSQVRKPVTSSNSSWVISKSSSVAGLSYENQCEIFPDTTIWEKVQVIYFIFFFIQNNDHSCRYTWIIHWTTGFLQNTMFMWMELEDLRDVLSFYAIRTEFLSIKAEIVRIWHMTGANGK